MTSGERGAFPGRLKVEAFNVVITSIVLVCYHPTLILFYLGSIYLYVSAYFSLGFDIPYDRISVLVHVSTLVGQALVIDQVYRSCLMSLVGYKTSMDMIISNMVDFDVILGMD